MPTIKRLRITAGFNKTYPFQYEAAILTALSHYPELRYTKILFKQKDVAAAPYSTAPSPASFLRSPGKRVYIITIKEKAEFPESEVLFKNLTFEAQVAVIAHELIHVIQFSKCSVAQLLKLSFQYLFPWKKRKIERGADIGAIEHGFGEGLYKHALFIRSVPGYVEQRPEINKYYLHPDEILQKMRA